jgi:gamma-glutamyltranspeptidase / glutathione hydrolase
LAALQMLNVLEGFDLASLTFNSVDHLHILTEAKKLAYADRAAYYADPAFGTARAGRTATKGWVDGLTGGWTFAR